MIKLIAALGNPGKEYAHTRHNAAWLAVEAWTAARGAAWKAEGKFEAIITKIGDILIVKPQTYMNLSGHSVQAAMNFYKIHLSEILVVHDEVAFDAGITRLSWGGSHGGHNGVANIIQMMGGNEHFWRLRLGVGPRDVRYTLADWVLAPLGEAEKAHLGSTKIKDILSLIVDKGPELAQNSINQQI